MLTWRCSASRPWQVREVGVGSHFLAQSERIAHIGLGPGGGPIYAVEIQWPSGQLQSFANVPRNTVLVATEPVSVPTLEWPLAVLFASVLLGMGAWMAGGTRGPPGCATCATLTPP